MFLFILLCFFSEQLFVLVVPVGAVVPQTFIGSSHVLYRVISQLLHVIELGLMLTLFVQSFIRCSHVIHHGLHHVDVRTRVWWHARAVTLVTLACLLPVRFFESFVDSVVCFDHVMCG